MDQSTKLRVVSHDTYLTVAKRNIPLRICFQYAIHLLLTERRSDKFTYYRAWFVAYPISCKKRRCVAKVLWRSRRIWLHHSFSGRSTRCLYASSGVILNFCATLSCTCAVLSICCHTTRRISSGIGLELRAPKKVLFCSAGPGTGSRQYISQLFSISRQNFLSWSVSGLERNFSLVLLVRITSAVLTKALCSADQILKSHIYRIVTRRDSQWYWKWIRIGSLE